jgi:flagellar protein FliL
MNNEAGKSKIMVIAIALVLILLLGGIGIFVIKGKGGKNKGKEVISGPKSELALGEFVVNLADTNQVRYLKTNIVLEIQGEIKSEGGKGEGEAKAPAAVRDAVIEVLGNQCFSALLPQKGKQHLKEQIIKTVNKRLEGAKVVDVYFSDFAMQ